MDAIVKRLTFAIALGALLAAGAQAQTTVNAASCNEADVNAVVNGPTHTAAPGDIINVPSGSCTWTSALSISVGITLMGNGTPNSTASTLGAGTTGTTLLDNVPSGPMINATVPYGQTLRISTFVIEPMTSSASLTSPIYVVGTCTSSGCPNLRIDNINFPGWTESGNGTQASWLVRTDGVFGVMDHNTLPSGDAVALANIHFSSWLGVGSYGDNSWSSPDTFGTNQALYFENNSLNIDGLPMEDCDESPATSGGGCRIVLRFNQAVMNGYPLGYFHGTDSTDRVRGGRQMEVYGNSIDCTSTSTGCYAGIADLRSGVLLDFGNTMSLASGSWFNSYVELDEYRTWSAFPPWGYCAGQGPYDDNDGTVYASGTISSVTGSGTSGATLVVTDTSQSWTANQWAPNGAPYSFVDTSQPLINGTNPGFEISSNTSDALSSSNYGQDYYDGPPTINAGDHYEILRSSVCIDQPSRSGGKLLSGSTPSPTGWVGETLDPAYEWDDGGAAPLHDLVSADTARIIANRDYYSGASGVQTSPTSPFAGTANVGWGTLANRPTTCTPRVAYWATDQGNWNQSGNSFGQGELFVCTATNTWTLYYTPYTYPHPLESSGSGTTVNPPTDLSATPH